MVPKAYPLRIDKKVAMLTVMVLTSTLERRYVPNRPCSQAAVKLPNPPEASPDRSGLTARSMIMTSG